MPAPDVFVVAEPGTSEAELMRYCREQLPIYKRPRSIQIVPVLPKTSSGKTDYQRLE